MVSQLLETFTTLVNRYKVRSVTLITETSIFHGFIGAINHCFFTNQSARNILIILQNLMTIIFNFFTQIHLKR